MRLPFDNEPKLAVGQPNSSQKKFSKSILQLLKSITFLGGVLISTVYVTFSVHLYVCPSVGHYISGTIHHVIIIFCTHVQNDIVRRFLIFKNFCFLGALKRAKNSPKWKIELTFVTHHISGMRLFQFLVHLCKLMIALGVFFIFSKFWFFKLLVG